MYCDNFSFLEVKQKTQEVEHTKFNTDELYLDFTIFLIILCITKISDSFYNERTNMDRCISDTDYPCYELMLLTNY